MKKLLVGLAGFVVVVVVVGLVTPPDFVVAKEVTIDAEPAAVHAYVGELKKWDEWSPWLEQDPTIKTTFGEQTTGVGASQSWTGKESDGELTFTKCDPETGIAYDMNFIMDENKIPSSAVMSYSVEDGKTKVTWSMNGTWKGAMPPVMDGWMKILSPWMIGSSFDKGLTKLKAKVEEQK